VYAVLHQSQASAKRSALDPSSALTLVLGDSIVAGAGASLECGAGDCIARFQRWLEARDGRPHRLERLARPDEHSDSLIAGGQLRDALRLLATQPAACVVLSIGANDLLPHLRAIGRDGFDEGLSRGIHQYELNLRTIVGAMRDAAPDALLVLLNLYDVFSLGRRPLPVEPITTGAVCRLNAAIATVARAHRGVVADAFARFLHREDELTSITARPRDIHPNALGHQVLAGALITAVQLADLRAPVSAGAPVIRA
jgi:lysophospholipase L1-like esterase